MTIDRVNLAASPTELSAWCFAVAHGLRASGDELHLVGHLFGRDRVDGRSSRGDGDERVVAVAVLFQIAGELGTAAQRCLDDGHLYASQALVRQLIEVEYLLWAFENDQSVARQWFNADRRQLIREFSPSSIRKHAEDSFDASEFEWHCNHGGHPTPTATSVLVHHSNCLPIEAPRSDLAIHLMRVWDRAVAAWKSLVDDHALVLPPPSLQDVLAGRVRHTCDCKPTSKPGLVQCLIDSASGRVSIHLDNAVAGADSMST